MRIEKPTSTNQPKPFECIRHDTHLTVKLGEFHAKIDGALLHSMPTLVYNAWTLMRDLLILGSGRLVFGVRPSTPLVVRRAENQAIDITLQDLNGQTVGHFTRITWTDMILGFAGLFEDGSEEWLHFLATYRHPRPKPFDTYGLRHWSLWIQESPIHLTTHYASHWAKAVIHRPLWSSISNAPIYTSSARYFI